MLQIKAEKKEKPKLIQRMLSKATALIKRGAEGKDSQSRKQSMTLDEVIAANKGKGGHVGSGWRHR